MKTKKKVQVKKQEPPKQNIYIRDVPVSLVREFKSILARKGQSLRKAIIALLQKEVGNDKRSDDPGAAK